MTRLATPLHLWIVGVVSLLWNAMGAFDYLMTQTRNAAYMARFTQDQLEFFYGFPIWVESCWAIAIWGSVAGSILLLMRKGLASPVFLVSLVAMVATAFHNYVLADGAELMGSTGLIFSIAIFLISVALWVYARTMWRRNVLD